ncbi:hypothetical protein YA0089_25930 [Pseudomonas viridiflava]|uniref:hypothetical protein n=1 Tax=Pseudomonas viridiflava TaxID=33069 RepID=UPI0018E5E457|nr:hypothetical protein [Pseudomonas viridiflava]MBI6727055.1 hypothetical protein [Pseudomonas viridiflava]
MPRSLAMGRLLIVAACAVLCGVAHGDTMTQTEMISFAKQRMSKENDISSLELNQMYAGRKVLILPISGTSWPGTLRAMPDQFVSFLARQYKVRETADDLIASLETKYETEGFESANTMVTRSDDYVFCIVDDGLRGSFESSKGFMRSFYGGLMPLYFERSDLFEFIRHHETSHCLDSASDGNTDGQKFLSVMINETKADLNATLVYANRHGNFNLFFDMIKPMRMGNVMDVEHTTEDAVEHLIAGIDPASLKDVPFTKIMQLRELLIGQLESKEMVQIMLRNAFEKQQMAEYLVQIADKNSNVLPLSMRAAVEKNKSFVVGFIPSSLRQNFDMERRFNAMIVATMGNHTAYSGYIDGNDEMIKNFRSSISMFGVRLPPETKSRLVNYPDEKSQP